MILKLWTVDQNVVEYLATNDGQIDGDKLGLAIIALEQANKEGKYRHN